MALFCSVVSLLQQYIDEFDARLQAQGEEQMYDVLEQSVSDALKDSQLHAFWETLRHNGMKENV